MHLSAVPIAHRLVSKAWPLRFVLLLAMPSLAYGESTGKHSHSRRRYLTSGTAAYLACSAQQAQVLTDVAEEVATQRFPPELAMLTLTYMAPDYGSMQPIGTVSVSRQGTKACLYLPETHQLVALGLGNTIKIWDTTHWASPARVVRSRHGWITSIAPGIAAGTLFAADVSRKIYEIDLATLTVTPLFTALHEGRTLHLIRNREGRHLLSHSVDDRVGVWTLLPAVDTTPLWLEAHHNWVAAVALHPTEDFCYIAHRDGMLSVWDLRDEVPQCLGIIPAHTGWIRTLSFDSRGAYAMTMTLDGQLAVWKLVEGYPELTSRMIPQAAAQALLLSHDDAELYVGMQDGRVAVWLTSEFHGGQEMPSSHRTLPPALLARGGVSCLTLTPDGKTLLGGTEDGYLLLWDLTAPDKSPSEQRLDEQEIVDILVASDGLALYVVCKEGQVVALRELMA